MKKLFAVLLTVMILQGCNRTAEPFVEINGIRGEVIRITISEEGSTSYQDLLEQREEYSVSPDDWQDLFVIENIETENPQDGLFSNETVCIRPLKEGIFISNDPPVFTFHVTGLQITRNLDPETREDMHSGWEYDFDQIITCIYDPTGNNGIYDLYREDLDMMRYGDEREAVFIDQLVTYTDSFELTDVSGSFYVLDPSVLKWHDLENSGRYCIIRKDETDFAVLYERYDDGIPYHELTVICGYGSDEESSRSWSGHQDQGTYLQKLFETFE